MRPPVAARPVTPRPSAVLHLDPEAVPADLGAQCERAAAARGAMQHGVGGQLRRDQDRLVGLRAAAQPPGELARASPACRGSAG